MRIATLVTLASLTAGTIVFAQSVTYDFDRMADFSKFKTYSWVRGTAVANEFMHQRIVNAIETQLASKGMIQVNAGANPDALVAYHAILDKNLQINGSSSGWGPYRFGGSRWGSARVEEITTGTVVVDIVDARTKTIVWRGMASKDIDPNANPEKRDKNINKATEKLFKNYPPSR